MALATTAMSVGTPTRDLFTYTVERIGFLALVLVVVIVAIWIYRRGRKDR